MSLDVTWCSSSNETKGARQCLADHPVSWDTGTHSPFSERRAEEAKEMLCYPSAFSLGTSSLPQDLRTQDLRLGAVFLRLHLVAQGFSKMALYGELRVLGTSQEEECCATWD